MSDDSRTDDATPYTTVLSALGGIDIYLLDLVMRGRLIPPMRVLDLGTGDGRNAVPLAALGFDVTALDEDPATIPIAAAHARAVLGDAAQTTCRFHAGSIEAVPPAIAEARFDAVLCIAVLHFARDRAHFDAMLGAVWRLVAPGGLLFARLATSIGLDPSTLEPVGDGRFGLPDDTVRFLMDDARFAEAERALGATRRGRLKTTLVAALRAMTTWVIEKPTTPDPA